MERSLAFGLAAVTAAALSFATLAVPRVGALSHLRDNAAWALMLATIVLAFLAVDGAKETRVKALIGVAIALAGARAIMLFAGLG